MGLGKIRLFGEGIRLWDRIGRGGGLVSVPWGECPSGRPRVSPVVEGFGSVRPITPTPENGPSCFASPGDPPRPTGPAPRECNTSNIISGVRNVCPRGNRKAAVFHHQQQTVKRVVHGREDRRLTLPFRRSRPT